MPKDQAVHRAAQSAAGYLYQARLALVEALRYAYVHSSIEIAVEKLDDVSFEKDGSALQLLQIEALRIRRFVNVIRIKRSEAASLVN